MAILLVPSVYPTIAAAMLSAAPSDTIQLESGYSDETATVTVNNITVDGGANSHGAVVAREYGIPAVVGVPGATARIVSGDRVTVDGAAGRVHVDRSTGRVRGVTRPDDKLQG